MPVRLHSLTVLFFSSQAPRVPEAFNATKSAYASCSKPMLPGGGAVRVEPDAIRPVDPGWLQY